MDNINDHDCCIDGHLKTSSSLLSDPDDIHLTSINREKIGASGKSDNIKREGSNAKTISSHQNKRKTNDCLEGNNDDDCSGAENNSKKIKIELKETNKSETIDVLKRDENESKQSSSTNLLINAQQIKSDNDRDVSSVDEIEQSFPKPDIHITKFDSYDDVVTYLETQNKNRIESLMEEIREHYFLLNNWASYIEFYTLKNRLDSLCIEKHVRHLLESFQLISSSNEIMKLLGYLPLPAVTPPEISSVKKNEAVFNSTVSSTSSLPSDIPVTIPSKENLSSSTEMNLSKSSAMTFTTSIPSNPTSPNKLLKTVDKKNDKSSPVKKLSISASLEESTIGSREQIVERAKKEAYVMRRIAELRKDGVWSIRRLPKVQEPVRTKTHWDYLLEEMQWLAADFANERKFKHNSAKKFARSALKYHTLKECQAERIEKEGQQKLRKIASSIAKMVKQFWANIEKCVITKQGLQLSEKRKKIHDMQLRFIVDKADHLTEKLAQELIAPSKNSKTSSIDSDLESSANSESIYDDDDIEEKDEEFKQGDVCSDDDEETIAKEEKNTKANDYEEELDALKAEGDMSIEDLLDQYGIDENYEKINETSDASDQDEEEESDDTDVDDGTETEYDDARDDNDADELDVTNDSADKSDDLDCSYLIKDQKYPKKVF